MRLILSIFFVTVSILVHSQIVIRNGVASFTVRNDVVNADQTTSFTASVGYNRLNPPTLLSTATITMPASPLAGDEVTLDFGGTITAGNTVVTSLTVAPNSGQTITGAFTLLQARGNDVAVYRAINSTTWRRIR